VVQKWVAAGLLLAASGAALVMGWAWQRSRGTDLETVPRWVWDEMEFPPGPWYSVLVPPPM
jgi:hypothetical protein